MQTNPVVNCPRLQGDRGPRRSNRYLLLRWPAVVALILALLLVYAAHGVMAQSEPQENAGQVAGNTAGEAAGQPQRPDTGQDTVQVKISQPAPATATPAGAPATIVLATIRDEQGLLAAAVPPAWSQVAQGEWRIAGAPAGRTLSASPNQGDFATNWGTPGIALYYSTSLPAAMEPEDLLGVFDYADACQDGGRGALPAGPRSVTYQIWQNCGGTGTAAAVIVLAPATRAYYAVVEVYMASVDDLRALGPMLQSVQLGAEAAAGATSPTGSTAGAGAEAGAGNAAATPVATLPPPTPEPTPTPAPVLATVITDRLNLRSGPSTATPRLTVVTRGMQLTVTGQTGSCAWLRVTTPDGQQGWVSGDPQFASLGAACATVPAVNP